MSKITIAINGKALVGKDTLCNIVIDHYKAIKVSAITPIKDIALQNGWNGVKDNKSRKFLSDLKRAFIDYNNLPNKYLVEEHRKFMKSNSDIMFVHIRESDQIDCFLNSIEGECITLLIRKQNGKESTFFGNYSDDYVDNYVYNYYYDNNQPLENLEDDFLEFFKNILNDRKIDDILPKQESYKID